MRASAGSNGLLMLSAEGVRPVCYKLIISSPGPNVRGGTIIYLPSLQLFPALIMCAKNNFYEIAGWESEDRGFCIYQTNCVVLRVISKNSIHICFCYSSRS